MCHPLKLQTVVVTAEGKHNARLGSRWVVADVTRDGTIARCGLFGATVHIPTDCLAITSPRSTLPIV
jgi:hypothetical protein